MPTVRTAKEKKKNKIGKTQQQRSSTTTTTTTEQEQTQRAQQQDAAGRLARSLLMLDGDRDSDSGSEKSSFRAMCLELWRCAFPFAAFKTVYELPSCPTDAAESATGRLRRTAESTAS